MSLLAKVMNSGSESKAGISQLHANGAQGIYIGSDRNVESLFLYRNRFSSDLNVPIVFWCLIDASKSLYWMVEVTFNGRIVQTLTANEQHIITR